ncbi:hypothetical protein DFQ26_005707 [Actinomortierella ambigua]|nr:hypothetical protein DFQ26_005707 [Actinomortierella ambigua]
MSDQYSDDSTASSGILLSRPQSDTASLSADHSPASSFVHEPEHPSGDSDVAQSYIHLGGKDLEAMSHSVLGSSTVDHEGLKAMRQVQQEEKQPQQQQQQPHQGDIVSQASGSTTKRPHQGSAAPAAPPATSSHPIASTTSSSTSTALITAQDAEPSRFWRLMSPIITRETAIWLTKVTAINFFLPFINGVFLGFGEICAHELAYRWGWTMSTHVVQTPGRDGQALGKKDQKNTNVSSVGLRASGGSNGSGAYAYTGSGSGVGGGLGRYENDFE